MALRTYDPASVVVSIAGVPISGYADGTFVSVDRDDDAFTKVTGADGNTTRIKSNNRSGFLTLTLLQSSPSNDILSGLAQLDEATNAGVVPVLVKDMSGNSIYFSAQGWIRKYPTSDFGKEINNREWIIDLADMDMFVGSNSNS